MSLARNLLGYREFWEPDAIRQIIENAPEFNPSSESVDEARTLLIFETSKQRTWLVATAIRLYCVLDDVRKDKPRLQWSVLKGEAAHIETRSKTDQTGLVDIGTRHRWWLYSKRLFDRKSIEQQISELIV